MQKEKMPLHRVTAELLLKTSEYSFLEQIEDDDDFFETVKSLACASQGVLPLAPTVIGRLIDIADLCMYRLEEGYPYGSFILYGGGELFVVDEEVTNTYSGYRIDYYEPGDKMYECVKELFETEQICESEIDAGTFLYGRYDGERVTLRDLYEYAERQ